MTVLAAVGETVPVPCFMTWYFKPLAVVVHSALASAGAAVAGAALAAGAGGVVGFTGADSLEQPARQSTAAETVIR